MTNQGCIKQQDLTDQGHVSGNGRGSATVGSHTMNWDVKSESKWIEATCPANAP